MSLVPDADQFAGIRESCRRPWDAFGVLKGSASNPPNAIMIAARLKGAWPSRPCRDWWSFAQRLPWNHRAIRLTQAGRLCPSLFRAKRTALGGTPALQKIALKSCNHADKCVGRLQYSGNGREVVITRFCLDIRGGTLVFTLLGRGLNPAPIFRFFLAGFIKQSA